MPRLMLISLVTAVTLFSDVPNVQADYPNSFCRHCGIGWSDGYHSHTACPPKRLIVHHKPAPAPAPKPVPWWAIPAEQHATPQPEELPTPAGQTPTTTGTSGTSGRSLLRQSGDSSTVSELNALSGAAASR
jgi:hypothetical protein